MPCRGPKGKQKVVSGYFILLSSFGQGGRVVPCQSVSLPAPCAGVGRGFPGCLRGAAGRGSLLSHQDTESVTLQPRRAESVWISKSVVALGRLMAVEERLRAARPALCGRGWAVGCSPGPPAEQGSNPSGAREG